MTNQLTLFGKTIAQQEEDEREEYRLEFYKSEWARLKVIREILIKGKGIIDIDGAKIKIKNGEPIFPDMWERKKFLGEWWYCNHIKGWNNNLPIKDNSCLGNIKYDDVPGCELMSHSIRDCFISVERDGVRWNRDYCLERLNKAIESYEEKWNN